MAKVRDSYEEGYEDGYDDGLDEGLSLAEEDDDLPVCDCDEDDDDDENEGEDADETSVLVTASNDPDVMDDHGADLVLTMGIPPECNKISIGLRINEDGGEPELIIQLPEGFYIEESDLELLEGEWAEDDDADA